MAAGLRARGPSDSLAPRPAPPGETPAFSVDATIGTGHGTAGPQEAGANAIAQRRAWAAGRSRRANAAASLPRATAVPGG